MTNIPGETTGKETAEEKAAYMKNVEQEELLKDSSGEKTRKEKRRCEKITEIRKNR